MGGAGFGGALLTGRVKCWRLARPFSDYVDRWWQEEHQANDFVKSMWEMYRKP